MFSNYRGISLLPILSKVLEKCVARRLVDFINSRLFSLQHSFRHGLSCTTQLLGVLHDIGRSLDRGVEIDVIYLDLTRAFDTVCHSRLLYLSFKVMVLLARFLVGFLITYLLVNNVSLFRVPLVLGNPSFLEFLRASFLDLYFSYFTSMIFHSVFAFPVCPCLPTIQNAITLSVPVKTPLIAK